MKNSTSSKLSKLSVILMLAVCTLPSQNLFAQSWVCSALFTRVQGLDTVYFFHVPNFGKKVTYSWTFGDGSTASTYNTKHRYASTGTFYVCLTVKDSLYTGGFCTQTWCDSVKVLLPPPPVCNAHFGYYAKAGSDSVYFFGGPNSSSATYAWDFGDGSSSTAKAGWHAFPNKLTYYVCLTVNNSSQSGTCSKTICDSVHVGKGYLGVHRLAEENGLTTEPMSASVYPNPVHDACIFHIENSTGMAALRVADLNGRIVYSTQLSNGDFTLNKTLAPGLYFYSVIDENNSMVNGKLIVE